MTLKEILAYLGKIKKPFISTSRITQMNNYFPPFVPIEDWIKCHACKTPTQEVGMTNTLIAHTQLGDRIPLLCAGCFQITNGILRTV